MVISYEIDDHYDMTTRVTLDMLRNKNKKSLDLSGNRKKENWTGMHVYAFLFVVFDPSRLLRGGNGGAPRTNKHCSSASSTSPHLAI